MPYGLTKENDRSKSPKSLEDTPNKVNLQIHRINTTKLNYHHDHLTKPQNKNHSPPPSLSLKKPSFLLRPLKQNTYKNRYKKAAKTADSLEQNLIASPLLHREPSCLLVLLTQSPHPQHRRITLILLASNTEFVDRATLGVVPLFDVGRD